MAIFQEYSSISAIKMTCDYDRFSSCLLRYPNDSSLITMQRLCMAAVAEQFFEKGKPCINSCRPQLTYREN
jgi:hypothetical protein